MCLPLTQRLCFLESQMTAYLNEVGAEDVNGLREIF